MKLISELKLKSKLNLHWIEILNNYISSKYLQFPELAKLIKNKNHKNNCF